MRAGWFALAILMGSSLAAQQEEGTPFNRAQCVRLLVQAAPSEQVARESRIEEDATSCSLAGADECVFPEPKVAVLAGNEDGRAFLRYTAEQAAPSDKVTWLVEATTPFDKEGEEGVFATHNGVAGDLTLATEAKVVSWSAFNATRYAEALCHACEVDGVKTLQDCHPETVAEKRGSTERQRARVLRDLQDAGFEPVVGRTIGAKLTLGRKEREFFESSGTVAKDDRIGFSAGATGTILLRNGLLAFELLAKRDYKQADPATVCKPLASGSVLEECKTKPRQRADAREGFEAGVEWKVPLGAFAVAPQVAHDFEEGSWALQLPIYFVPGKGGLTGGLRLGWKSEGNDFSAAIFVAQPLKFTP